MSWLFRPNQLHLQANAIAIIICGGVKGPRDCGFDAEELSKQTTDQKAIDCSRRVLSTWGDCLGGLVSVHSNQLSISDVVYTSSDKSGRSIRLGYYG